METRSMSLNIQTPALLISSTSEETPSSSLLWCETASLMSATSSLFFSIFRVIAFTPSACSYMPCLVISATSLTSPICRRMNSVLLKSLSITLFISWLMELTSTTDSSTCLRAITWDSVERSIILVMFADSRADSSMALMVSPTLYTIRLPSSTKVMPSVMASTTSDISPCILLMMPAMSFV